MDRMISMCGLVCSDCHAFLATRANDYEMRKKVAETWSKEYHADITPESINCHGCLATDGVLFHHCTVCEIRQCGLEHKVENCSCCPDYKCDKISQFFKMVPTAQELLDSLRSSPSAS